MLCEIALTIRLGWKDRHPTIELGFRIETKGLEEAVAPFLPPDGLTAVTPEPLAPSVVADWWKTPVKHPYIQERRLADNCDQAIEALRRMGYRDAVARESILAAKNAGATTVSDLIRQALMGNDQEHERRHAGALLRE